MAKKYRVNKDKCVGCGVCVATCPKGNEMGEDGKARVVNSEELEKCGGESVCPYGAIEEVEEKE